LTLNPPPVTFPGRPPPAINAVTFHSVPLKGDIGMLYLYMLSYEDRKNGIFDLKRIQAGAILDGGLENALVARAVKVGTLRSANRFVSMPSLPANSTLSASEIDRIYQEIFENSDAWNWAMKRLNNDPGLISRLNDLTYASDYNAPITDHYVGLGCLVPSVTKGLTYAVYQRNIHDGGIGLKNILAILDDVSKILKPHKADRSDVTFFYSSSVGDVLKHLINTNNARQAQSGQPTAPSQQWV
jgi:hypothetical protein